MARQLKRGGVLDPRKYVDVGAIKKILEISSVEPSHCCGTQPNMMP